MKTIPIIFWRHRRNSGECPIKGPNGIITYVLGNFCNRSLRIAQHSARRVHTKGIDERAKRHICLLAQHLRNITLIQMEFFRKGFQGYIFGKMSATILQYTLQSIFRIRLLGGQRDSCQNAGYPLRCGCTGKTY